MQEPCTFFGVLASRGGVIEHETSKNSSFWPFLGFLTFQSDQKGPIEMKLGGGVVPPCMFPLGFGHQDSFHLLRCHNFVTCHKIVTVFLSFSQFFGPSVQTVGNFDMVHERQKLAMGLVYHEPKFH